MSLDVFESCQVFFLLHSQIRITFVAKYGCWHHSCLHIDWMQKVNQNYCAIFQIMIDSNFLDKYEITYNLIEKCFDVNINYRNSILLDFLHVKWTFIKMCNK